MNKRLKILVATLLVTMSLTTMMTITISAEGINPNQRVEEALQQKTFYSYNMAYAEVMKMEDIAQRDRLLGELSSITNIVWTYEIKNINTLIADMCKTASGKTYDEIEATVNKSNLCEMDKGYLLGELTSWGRKLVWTPDYVSGVNILNDAWAKLESQDGDTVLANAENKINEIKNEPSRQYLLGELSNAKAARKKKVDIVGSISEIRLSKLTEEQKMIEIGKILSVTKLLEIPSSYRVEQGLNQLTSRFVRFPDRLMKNIEDFQEVVDSAISDTERDKLKALWFKNEYVDIKANYGTQEIDVTDQVVIAEPAMIEGVRTNLLWAGTATGPHLYDYRAGEYLIVRNNRVYLKPKVPTSGIIKEEVRIVVNFNTIKNPEVGSTSSIMIRINP